MMALILLGKTRCLLCSNPIQSGEDVVAFPAFLPTTHELTFFSDAPFHRICFDADSRNESVNKLYRKYREIWDSRPKHLNKMEEIEAWGRKAFKNFPP
ncbi:MAG: hypothetical protein KF782_25290 [Labilithrix sp.]|nr:hypothetical protein [Labilithrix sp.]